MSKTHHIFLLILSSQFHGKNPGNGIILGNLLIIWSLNVNVLKFATHYLVENMQSKLQKLNFSFARSFLYIYIRCYKFIFKERQTYNSCNLYVAKMN